jgi:hypothetical protein
MKTIKITGAIFLTVGIFLTGLLIFPLEFFFLSFVLVLYLLRTIEKQIDTMGKSQIQELIDR